MEQKARSDGHAQASESWIVAPLRHPVGIYVHIPFCRSRCRYCDFYVETGVSARVLDNTLRRVLEEARFFMDAMGHPPVSTVYIGGGTPSLIPPDTLHGFLHGLEQQLDLDGPGNTLHEWTIEANPESLTTEFIDVLKESPVDRLSVGVQSFQDHLLRLLGRRAHRDTVLAALELLAQRWDGRLTLDMMTGIPGQSEEDLQADLETVVSWDPGHVSLYALTVEPETPLSQAIAAHMIEPLDAERQDAYWLAARRHLEDHAYGWYEISNFAKPGQHSRHNMMYWRYQPYAGLGPGGVGTLPIIPGGEPDALTDPVVPARLTNPNLFRYASQRDPRWKHGAELIDAHTLLFEHFMMGLRTSEGLDLQRINAIFDLSPQLVTQRLREGWSGWPQLDANDLADERLVLMPEGRLQLNSLLVELSETLDELSPEHPPLWPGVPTAGP
jgi:oxygen-independent coproporphyrinogen-3 oxidase